MNRRQILKGLISAVVWLPLLIKKEEVVGYRVYNTIPQNDLPRKKVYFPSLSRNGGEVGHESFITEWHIGGDYARISNVKFINTEIHFNHAQAQATILNCELRNTYSLVGHPNRKTITLKRNDVHVT